MPCKWGPSCLPPPPRPHRQQYPHDLDLVLLLQHGPLRPGDGLVCLLLADLLHLAGRHDLFVLLLHLPKSGRTAAAVGAARAAFLMCRSHCNSFSAAQRLAVQRVDLPAAIIASIPKQTPRHTCAISCRRALALASSSSILASASRRLTSCCSGERMGDACTPRSRGPYQQKAVGLEHGALPFPALPASRSPVA